MKYNNKNPLKQYVKNVDKVYHPKEVLEKKDYFKRMKIKITK